MCYELTRGALLHTPLECGPTRSGKGLNRVKDEPKNIYDCLINVIPNIRFDYTIFRPTWVCKNSIMYQNNNTYLMTGTDGLHHLLYHLNEVLVIGGGDMLRF